MINKLSNAISQGFTIVELLVSIVIIGILAALIGVSYAGITGKSMESTLQSDLKQAALQIEIYKTENGAFPAEGSAFVNDLPKSDNTVYEYILEGDTYHLNATSSANSGIAYNITNGSVLNEGEYEAILTDTFAVVLEGVNPDEEFLCRFVTQASDGGYATAGWTTSYGAGSTDVYLAKYGADGAMDWNKTWGGSAGDYAHSIIQTSDGGYVVAGNQYSYGAGSSDAFILKFTSDGTLSWNKIWGGTGSDIVMSAIQTSDGGYAVTGYTNSYGAGNYDAFILKYTSNGTLSWNKTWGGASGNDQALDLVQTSDGGYIVIGETYSFGGGVNDAFATKFDSSGSLSWDNTWGGSGFDAAQNIVLNTDGGYAISGYTTSFSAGTNDMFIAKYNSSGSMYWNKTWGGTGTQDIAEDMLLSYDGGYVLAGYTNSFGAGGYDAALVKFSSTGVLAWDQTWGGASGDSFKSMVQASDGGYAMVGTTGSFGAGGNDIVVAKFTSNGLLSWNKTFGGVDYDYGLDIDSTIDGGYVASGDYDGLGNDDLFITRYTSTGDINGCSSPICQTPSATVSSPSAVISTPSSATGSPSASVSSPSASTSSPSATVTSPSITETYIVTAQ